jgi:alkylhydroperoxidase family enzyme
VREDDDGERKLAEVATWRDSTLFSSAERIALEYAERITHTDQQVDDEIFTRLKLHYDEAQIVELTATVALENFRSKFNPSLDIAAQGFCLVPRRGR